MDVWAFCRSIAIAVGLTLVSCVSVANAGDRPSFVFIIADDLGWADVDFHGGNAPTPNLTRLLGEGIELRQHYVAPVCSPTRAGFMTGRYWSRFGVTTPTNTLALPPSTITVPRALRDAGYETCISGKWHLGSTPQWGPNHYGFDHSYGSLAGGVTPWSHYYKKGPYSVTWHRNESLFAEEGHVTDLIASEAIKWLENRSHDQPFMLYVPFTAVHLPIREPESWVARVPKDVTGVVPRQYAAAVMHLDDAVGRIVAAVDRSGRSDRTLVVFTSDNGGSTSENNDRKYPDDHCASGKLPGNNLPLRGKKGDLYEGGTRVPAIVRWPGRIKAGSVSETPVHIVDWMPTFCELAGSRVDAERLRWDGVSLRSVLSGDDSLPERSLYSAGTSFRSRALRRGDWKLIIFDGKDSSQQRVELFDIASDPNEKNNLAQSNPDKVRELKAELMIAMRADRDAVVQPPK